MHVSIETAQQTHERLTRVLALADFQLLDGTYAFGEMPRADGALPAQPGALAYVRDDEVWSWLAPSWDPAHELLRVFCFHFPEGVDNSGFVGWLASQLKARTGTGVVVLCGQNSNRGGIFDYWGCPESAADRVLAEIERLRSGATHSDSGERSLDGVRMSVVATAATGEVGEGTILRFTQEGAVISAHYAGGTIRVGYLAGVRDGSRITFRYTQVDDSGRVDGGRSQCELSSLADGRLRLTEHFQWESREDSGTNVFEEIA